VLRAWLTHPNPMGRPENTLGVRRERKLSLGRQTGVEAKSLTNQETDRLDGHREVRQHSANGALIIAEQAEEQMLDVDCSVPHLPSLLLGTRDCLARLVCEHLKHNLIIAGDDATVIMARSTSRAPHR